MKVLTPLESELLDSLEGLMEYFRTRNGKPVNIATIRNGAEIQNIELLIKRAKGG